MPKCRVRARGVVLQLMADSTRSTRMMAQGACGGGPRDVPPEGRNALPSSATGPGASRRSRRRSGRRKPSRRSQTQQSAHLRRRRSCQPRSLVAGAQEARSVRRKSNHLQTAPKPIKDATRAHNITLFALFATLAGVKCIANT